MPWTVPLPIALAVLSFQAPLESPCSIDSPFALGVVDRVASLVTPATTGRPFYHRRDSAEVKVRLRFVIGCDGRAEPSSFMLVNAVDSAYVLSAVAMVQASRFSPALVAGRPVRQIVEREVVWRDERDGRRVEFDCPPARDGAPIMALRSIAPEPVRSRDAMPVRRSVIVS